MTTITLHQVVQLARQLPRHQRRELIALLERDLPREESSTQAADAWARLDAFRAELVALGPTTSTLAEQLEDDRQSRQAMLEGHPDVHP